MRIIKKIFCKLKIPLVFTMRILMGFFMICCNFVLPSANSLLKIVEKEKQNYEYALVLWNVDTFEGGSLSREAWLNKKSLEFEKQNEGVFVIVKNMSPEQALLNIQSLNFPHMISYGPNIGCNFLNSLTSIEDNLVNDVRKDLLSSGLVNGKVYAVPIMFGGYIFVNNNNLCQNINTKEFSKNLVTKNKQLLGIALNDYYSPQIAVALNGSSINKNDLYGIENQKSSYEIYQDFLKEKFATLLGTQRDLYRINNRIKNGKMQNIEFEYLSNFTDLIQYISVFNNDKFELKICNKFIQYLLSNNAQKSLSDIGLFSPTQSIYTEGNYFEMEQALNKKLLSINAFLDKNSTDELKNIGLNSILNNSIENKNLIEKLK